MLKALAPGVGARLVEEMRRLALDSAWFAATTASYPAGALGGCEGRRPSSIREVPDNVTDLVVFYEFADAPRLVGKFFLPVVKSRPHLGFEGLDDRGDGSVERMRWMAEHAVAVRVPAPLWYDARWRVLWMEDAGDGIEPLAPGHWPWALPRIASAIAAVHAAPVPPERVDRMANALYRDYLIRYPVRFLEPFLEQAGYTGGWQRFVDEDARSPRALIYGDFKPRNLGVRDGEVWFLDLERANVANPAYDLGCMLCHLLIDVFAASQAPDPGVFWRTYAAARGPAPAFERCVAHYLLLFLAYRTATWDVLGRRASPRPFLERAIAHWFADPERPIAHHVADLDALARGASTTVELA